MSINPLKNNIEKGYNYVREKIKPNFRTKLAHRDEEPLQLISFTGIPKTAAAGIC
jgi:hypothetical protein